MARPPKRGPAVADTVETLVRENRKAYAAFGREFERLWTEREQALLARKRSWIATQAAWPAVRRSS